jgi:Na+/melibiose symporter-like transporter
MYINFLLFFYTDVFGIPAAVAGTLFVISRFWDAVNDPMMGIIADRTNTKWGKFRPYLIWIMLPLAVIGVLMFTTPNLSIQGKIIYAYVTYILMMMAYTAINIPYSALLGVLSPDTMQRTSASTYRFVLAFVGAFIVQGATLPLVNSMGSEKQGFVLSNHMLTIKEVSNRTSRIMVTADDGVNQATHEFLVKVNRKDEQPPIVNSPLNDLKLEQGFNSHKINISNVFRGIDGHVLTYKAKSSNIDVIATSLLDHTLTLKEKGVGSSEITLTAIDDAIGQKDARFSVHVNAIGNHPPFHFKALADTTFRGDSGTHTINISEIFSDENGDLLSYSTISVNPPVVSAEISDNVILLQLKAVGISGIILTANDNKGGVASDTFLVKVQSTQNDPPAIYHPLENIELTEGFKQHRIDISDVFQDLDGDPLSYSVRMVDIAKGFQFTLIIYGILACILFYLTFAATKERVHPPKDQRTSLKNDFRDLIRNRPWMILLGMGIFTLGYVIIRIGTIMYYFKYYIENEILAALFMVLGTVGVIVGVASTEYLSRRLGKKKLYLIVMFLSTVFTMLFYFIPKDRIVLIFAVHIIISLVMAPQAPLLWAMYADTADYSEWKNGRRATGLIFSAATFAQKFGMALGGGVAGWLLALFSFQPNVQQSPETLNGIRLMMSFIPAIGSLVAALFALFYELDDKIMKKIEKELADRKIK